MNAEVLIHHLRTKGQKISTVESCTGGLVASALTDISGSSAVFERGFVTYSNDAKIQMVGVDPKVFEEHGAVSMACVTQMALGGCQFGHSDYAVSISGVAGPTGGSPEKPVGLVWFAFAQKSGKVRTLERRYGPLSRIEIRQRAVEDALLLALQSLEDTSFQTE